jgi:Holliday junction DNA helicase RuvA
MIARLRGEIAEIGGGYALVDVHGVGYEVYVPEVVALQLGLVGQEVTLLIRQIFREDGVSLYGFLNPFQRRVFDLLLSVKGCGPKVALSLLSLGEDNVANAILAQDARALARATGVGARLGERICLELKDKIQEEALSRKIETVVPVKRAPSKPSDDLMEALLALGYRQSEVSNIVDAAREQADDVESQIRVALRLLNKSQ